MGSYHNKSKKELIEEIEKLQQQVNSLNKQQGDGNPDSVLSEVEKQFQLIIEESADAIFIIDKQGKYQYANKAACNMLGYTLKELIKCTVADIAVRENQEDTFINLNKLIEKRRLLKELKLYKKDSSIVDVELNAVVLPNGLIYGSCRNIEKRKKLEEILQASEARFKMVMHQSPSIIEIYDLDGLQVYVNQAYEKLWGFPADHTVNKFNVLKSKEIEAIGNMQYIKKAYAGEYVVLPEYEFDPTGETEAQGKGRSRWLSTRIYPLKDKGGKVTSIVITHEDITDRKIIEKELLESENKFKAVYYTSPDAFTISKMDGEYVDVNYGFTRLTEYTSDEVIGVRQAELNIWNDIKDREKLIKELEKECIVENYETIIRSKTNKIKTVLISAQIIQIKKEPHVILVTKDITERKEIEDRLRQRNTFIQTVLDNLPIGLALNKLDDGSALYMNKKFEEIYGWGEQEIRNIQDFFEKVYPDEEYRKEITKRVMVDIESGDPEKMHWENIKVTGSDGENRFVNAVNIPLHSQNTMVSTVINITELKKAEKELKQKNKELAETVNKIQEINIQLEHAKDKAEESDKLKTAFIANISHEIRTPMNGILGFSDLLRNPNLTGKQFTDYINIIKKSGTRMLNIINDLIDISKIESGQVKLFVEKFSCNEIMESLFNFFQHEARNKNITLVYKKNVAQAGDILYADRNKLIQILTNLINNAIKFTTEGYIEYAYNSNGNKFEFYVKDTGRGIPAELTDKIFERFRQADLTPEDSEEGTGLGLSISKAFVELMGGDISVESKLNKGSVFKFSILSQSPNTDIQVTGVKESGEMKLNQSVRMLVAEDDEISYALIQEMFLNMPVEIIRVKNGKEAIDTIKTDTEIDVVLMDIKMPEINGIEATRTIKRMRPDLPIIAQTAFAANNDKGEAIAAGCDDYIAKPIDKILMIEKIKKHISKPIPS